MTTVTNPLDLELRRIRDGQIVIYNNRSIAKITQDGTMMADVREVRRNAAVLETLGVSRAMFVVEQQRDVEDILRWRKLADFRKLTLNCFFIVTGPWLYETLRKHSDVMQEMESIEITAPTEIDAELFLDIVGLFPNMESLRIMGRSFER
jgi:hypothetical protein